MRNFTKIMLSLAMAFGLLGGVSSVSAGNTYASISVATGCDWNSGTSTMSFTAVNGWQILLTGLPNGDITSYKKFHATLSAMSDNIENIRLCVKDNGGDQAWKNLTTGENNIDLAALATEYPDCDFSNVADITIWSPSSSAAGKTVDGEHPASVKIQNVYLQCVKNITSSSFGDEITELSYITGGNKFVIGDETNAMYFTTGENARNSLSTAVTNVPSDSYYYYTLTNAGLDLNGDSEIDDDLFIVSIVNKNGDAFPNQYGWSNKLNISQWGGGIFSANATSPNYGQDYTYGAVWKVAYVEDNKFTFKNVSSELGNYMKVASSQAETYCLKLYKSINFNVNTELDKEDNASNEAIFALADATGYNAETGEMTNGTWTFATPADLSNWDYLVIAAENSSGTVGHEITITDDDGISVHGDGYNGSDAGTYKNMWLSNWHNQNIVCISLDYLRITKNMDLSKIKTLSIGGTVKLTAVYLTDYENTQLTSGRNSTWIEGNVVRAYTANGKWGTICLPYVASYTGAEVFSIVNSTASSISLNRVSGLLEPGKPYFYKATDEVGKYAGNTPQNTYDVNFFQADLDTYNAADPGTNNGLIGTFSGTTAPAGANYYILSNNTLYNTVGCTGDDAVTIGANKAYVDISAITPSAARGVIDLFFDETTGVAEVKAQSENARCEFYNLAGQRVAQPTKGMYIVNGKKVILK